MRHDAYQWEESFHFFYYFNLCCGVLHRYPVGALHVNHIPELFRLGETLLALPPNHTHSLSLTESFSGHLAASFLLLLGGLGMIFYKWGLSGNLSTLLFFESFWMIPIIYGYTLYQSNQIETCFSVSKP